jgi:hypothetical protein
MGPAIGTLRALAVFVSALVMMRAGAVSVIDQRKALAALDAHHGPQG